MTSKIDRTAVLVAVLSSRRPRRPPPPRPAPRCARRAASSPGAVANGVVSWKGIPYAAPPVGDLRWRAPQPVAPWTGVRAATEYAHDCMQLPFPSDAAPLGTPPAEDCLYVNVWAPGEAGLREAARDVLDPRRRLRERRQLARRLRRERLRPARRRLREPQPPPRPLRLLRPPGPHEGEPERAPSATTATSTRSRPCAGCRRTSPPSAATPATSRSSASRPAAARCNTLIVSPLARGPLPQGDRAVGRRPRGRAS